MKTEHVHISMFRAIDHAEKSQELKRHHQERLADFNLSVSSASTDWTQNPHAYCITAEDKRHNTLLGGVRVHLANNDHLLPLQEAVKTQDSKLTEWIEQGDGECCGLWVAKGYFVFPELSNLLSKSMIVAARVLRCRILYGFSPPHMLDIYSKMGFTVDRRFGDDGAFRYPNENYLSKIIQTCPQILSLNTPKDRLEIVSISENKIHEEYYRAHGALVRVTLDFNCEKTTFHQPSFTYGHAYEEAPLAMTN